MKKELKVIDWDLALELANGRKELVKEILFLLVKTLPQIQNELDKAYSNYDISSLQAAAHKLHSANCYSGTTRLKVAAKKLETICKERREDEIPTAYNTVCEEIKILLTTIKSSYA